jgi:CBS domain-containing protein
MATKTVEINSQVMELATEAFEAFCSDIVAMFGLKVECKQQDVSSVTVESLKERFRTPAAFSAVKSKGFLQGDYGLVFGKEALFTLAGAVTMPEQMTSLLEKCVGPQKVLDNINKGTIKEAEQVRDAISEAGNLMVGSWDRVFRERVKGHGHFLQTETLIGEPWDSLRQKIGLAEDEKLVCAIYEMKVGTYPAFDCAVVFPDAMIANINLTLLEEGHVEEVEEEKAEEKDEAATSNDQDKAEVADEEIAQSSESDSESPEQEPSNDKPPDEEKKLAAEEEKGEGEEKETEAEQEIEDTNTDISEQIGTEQEENEEVEPEEEPAPQIKQRKKVSGEFSLQANAEVIMDTDVFWCRPEDSVELALNKMRQHNTGYLMIGTDGVLEGIVSSSDIAGAMSPYLRPIFAKWTRPMDSATLNIKLKWIMTRPVQTVNPETSLMVITENMCRLGRRCLPVVDRKGKVQGLITVFDILQVLLNTDPNISTVGKTLQSIPLVKLDS